MLQANASPNRCRRQKNVPSLLNLHKDKTLYPQKLAETADMPCTIQEAGKTKLACQTATQVLISPITVVQPFMLTALRPSSSYTEGLKVSPVIRY